MNYWDFLTKISDSIFRKFPWNDVSNWATVWSVLCQEFHMWLLSALVNIFFTCTLGVKRFVIIYMELTLIFRCLLNVAKYVAYSQLICNHHRASPWHWISENFLWKVIECVIHIMDIFLSLINEGFTFRTSRMAQIIEPMLVIQGMEM